MNDLIVERIYLLFQILRYNREKKFRKTLTNRFKFVTVVKRGINRTNIGH